ncbi:MAG: hypothetical protein GY717_19565 [Rhodobacteraceae bacterium]|nr:hypothetical protein [Paracoccaceae bacterium]
MSSDRRQPLNDPTEQRHSLFRGGKFALGTITGIILAISGYLLFGFADLSLSRPELLELVPTSIALLVAFVSLLMSYQAISEQRLMRQAGTDPVVLVHLGTREDTRALATFEVTNVGAGAALDVSIKLKSDISEIPKERIIVDFKRIEHPIQTIPQNKSVSYNFGFGHKLLGDEPVPPLEFEITYKNIEGTRYRSRQIIDVRELHQQRADSPPLARLASATEEMAKAQKGLGRKAAPIHVVSETRTDHETRQKAQHEEMLRQHRNKQEDEN